MKIKPPAQERPSREWAGYYAGIVMDVRGNRITLTQICPTSKRNKEIARLFGKKGC